MTDIVISHGPIARGRKTVLEAGELRFPPGSVIGLIGANGAGKTTLLMAMAGVLAGQPNVDVAGISGHGVGYLDQHPALPAWLTGREASRLYGVGDESLERLASFGIKAHLARRVGTLSPGQRQLLGALLILSLNCPITLLDEPLSALDMQRRRQLLELIRDRSRGRDDGITLLSSQVPADLHGTCDRFVVIRDGSYAFQGSKAEFLPPGAGSLQDFEERALDLMG